MPSLRLPILALLSILAPPALHGATPVYRNAVLADNPVAYWELDESSGTTAADSAPPAQNGSFQNVTLAQPSAFPALGTAAGFNGSSSRVRVPANAAFQLGTGNFSVEAWARTPVASRGDIFNYKNANDFGLFLNNNGSGSISGWHNGQLPVFTTTLDAWHHIVATRSNGVLRLFVDGLERGSQANTQSFSAGADLFLGANHTGAPAYAGTIWFNGWIDEVAVYASALTPARILAHYNAAQPPPTPATISILPASSLTSSSATISARVTDPGSAIPDITFFWGNNDAGSTGPWDHEVSAGPSSGTVSLSLSALSQGTTYFYRARALNPAGPAWSESLSFTTPIPAPPSILTLPATSIAGRSAVLNASVTSTGNDPPAVTLYFGPIDGGTNPAAWASSFPLGSSSTSPSRPVSPLAPLTTYFCRAAATNSAGTSWAPASISFSTTAWSPPAIVINEIHFNDDDPAGHSEFIELHNPGNAPADLAGAFFDAGINFTLPASTTIPPGGFLIVCEDPDTILRRWGRSGPSVISWQDKTTPSWNLLSNNGETIRLRDPSGAIIDVVDYQLGFPWPTVGDLPYNSIELIHPALDNNLGGHWRNSSGTPTPLAPNRSLSTLSPPAVRQVDHAEVSTNPPAEWPRSGNPVRISARITDPDGVTSVSVSYQIVEPGTYISDSDPRYNLPASWTSLPMSDDGTNGDLAAADGTFSALIPATVQQHRRLIRYRISATDSTNSSIRTPYTDDPQQNFAYFVYDSIPAWSGAARPGTTTPVSYQPALLESVPPFHLITSTTEHAAAQSIPVTNPNGSTSPAGAPYTHSLYNWKGALCHRGIVYDHIRYRARGGVWRFAMGKNMWKFDFNRGHDFAAYDNYGRPYSQKWRKLNFSSCIQQGDFLHRGEQGLFESVGFRLFQLSGIPAAHTNFAHFRIIERPSESNNSASQFDDDFQGLYLAVEQPDGQFLDEHNLPDGNLYKMENGTGELNNKGAGQPDNKSDLVAFQAYTPSESWWRANCNLPAYFNYRAIVDCIHHYDIGDGKNYCFYRNPLTSRWQPVPWDLDLTWADNMYRADSGIAGLAPSSNSTEPFFAPVFGNGSTSGIPAIRAELRNRTREILDLLWNQEQTGLLIDEMASVIYQPNQPSFVDADRALWDYNPILVSSAVNPSKAGHGRFYQRSADSPDGIANSAAGSPAGSFSGMITTLKNYINTRRSVITSQILTATEENLVPATPVISRSIPGTNPIAVNSLAFSSSAFSGRNGAAFAAIQWRLAPITDPAAPDFNRFNRHTPRLYEIDAAWLSPELPAFSPSITIPASAIRPGTVCRARVRHKDANGRWSHWSAPAQFTTAPPDISPYLNSLVVSQVMYHPPDPSSAEALVSTDPEDFEWIEILNVGPITLDLSAVRFTKGIDFDFANSAAPSLAPGQRAIVVRNPAAFAARYPTRPPNTHVARSWQPGDNLSNAGESIRLSFGTGTTIREFTYDDASPWPTEADGNGFPLVLIAPSSLPDHALPSNWRSGTSANGNPGASDSRNLAAYLLSFSLSNPSDDPDGDGFSTLAEYALGSHPLLPDSSPRIVPAQAMLDVGRGPEPFFTLSISVPHATDDITISAESSADLVSWQPDAVLLERSRRPDGSLFLGWRSANPITSPANRWFRLRITPR
jgi:hypothetical protein